jgi:hypothetical protein
MLLTSHHWEIDFQIVAVNLGVSYPGFYYSGIRHKNEILGSLYNDKNYQSFCEFWVFVVFQPDHYEGFVKNRSFSSYPP